MNNQVGEWKKSVGINIPSVSKMLKAEGGELKAEGGELRVEKNRAVSSLLFSFPTLF